MEEGEYKFAHNDMMAVRSGNGDKTSAVDIPLPSSRADEIDGLLSTVKPLIVDFIRAADKESTRLAERSKNISTNGDNMQLNGHSTSYKTALLEPHPPKQLEENLNFTLTNQPQGPQGLISTTNSILSKSLNPFAPGFLDKLYASPRPPSLAADALLSALNTNVHVYGVSPALTVIERQTCRALAGVFGFKGEYAGGVGMQGGSAANLSAMVIARNSLFPETKTEGMVGRKFVLFTSEHGHYSLEKTAQMIGLGTKAVRSVPVDLRGKMVPAELDRMIIQAKAGGETPFFVNATAGTTVLGSFDPLEAVADVCAKHKLWMHVDGSWGGAVAFSASHRHRIAGVERSDSVAMCPHKMLGVGLTCSVLLGKDLRQFQAAMGLRAGYLFHDDHKGDVPEEGKFWDLGDLTPQCGRRGDVLKLALCWVYYGSEGFEAYVDHGYEMAAYLAKLVDASEDFSLLSEPPPPCLQVCFYYRKRLGGAEAAERNSRLTERIKDGLVFRGFMIDYAPGDDGKFFRVVVNGQTTRETVEALVSAVEAVGRAIEP